MLHKIARDLRNRNVVFGLCLVLWFSLQATGVSMAGDDLQRCVGSGLGLKQNLPLGDTTARTEIVDIRALVSTNDIDGWVYRTRQGRFFVEPRNGHGAILSNVFAAWHMPASANTARVFPRNSFFEIRGPEASSMGVHFKAVDHQSRCFARPPASRNARPRVST